jgi:hypothetical protein
VVFPQFTDLRLLVLVALAKLAELLPHLLRIPSRMATGRDKLRLNRAFLAVPLNRAPRQTKLARQFGSRHEPLLSHSRKVSRGEAPLWRSGAACVPWRHLAALDTVCRTLAHFVIP